MIPPTQVELHAEGPQQETLTTDINAALNAEPQARKFFESLATLMPAPE
jgi:hypothetical protein